MLYRFWVRISVVLACCGGLGICGGIALFTDQSSSSTGSNRMFLGGMNINKCLQVDQDWGPDYFSYSSIDSGGAACCRHLPDVWGLELQQSDTLHQNHQCYLQMSVQQLACGIDKSKL
jgi:hypothetical protein